ncbi:MAG: peptide deformylase [Bacillota bacterium]
MAIKEILLLGDDRLYNISEEIKEEAIERAEIISNDLHDTMMEFRRKYGFGRAIAAPQIGESVRIIYMNIQGNATTFISPRLEWPDDEMFEMWDDCMSFPGLEVRLSRHKRCRVYYKDLSWKDCVTDYEGDLAELFQHEYDHLDGILAVQRAVNNKAYRINREKAGCY